jgi:hypothetical protein
VTAARFMIGFAFCAIGRPASLRLLNDGAS